VPSALIQANKLINSRLLSVAAFVIRLAFRASLDITRFVILACPIRKPFSSQL